MERLKVVVMTHDPQGQDEVLGEIVIPVSRLRDQYRHDELFDLQDLSGRPVSGKIHLVLQWIHSRVKYLSDVIKKWDDHIRTQIEDKAEYERDLAILYEPFKGLLKLKSPNAGAQGRQPRQAPKNDFSGVERGGGGVQNGGLSIGKKLGASLGQGDTQWLNYSYYASLLVFLFAVLAGFGRNTFLDVTNHKYFPVLNYKTHLPIHRF